MTILLCPYGTMFFSQTNKTGAAVMIDLFEKRKNVALSAFRDMIKMQHSVDLVTDRVNVDVEVLTDRQKDHVVFHITLTGDCAFEGVVKSFDDGELVVELSADHRLPQPKPEELFGLQ